MFKFAAEFPFASDENKCYLDIAHDGRQTYLSTDSKEVFILDDGCRCIEQIHTYHSYHTVCHDEAHDCLWAASQEFPDLLFCLSVSFEEKKRISLHGWNKDDGAVGRLFCDAITKQLYFTGMDGIYTVDPSGEVEKISDRKGNAENVTGICAYAGHVIVLSGEETKQKLSIYEIASGNLLEEQLLPKDYSMSAMSINRDSLNPLSFCLRFLVLKQDSTPFLVDYKPELSFFVRYALPSLSAAERAEGSSDISVQQLPGGQLSFPFFYPGSRRGGCGPGFHQPGGQHTPQKNFRNPGDPMYQNPGCNPGCSPDCNPRSNPSYNPCNNPGCNPCSNPGYSSPECHYPPCWCQSLNDVIESIALTEASIAHILNVEGEKLEKAIASSSNISELLAVNDSVKNTIIHSTHLEQMLFYKLEAVLRGESCACNFFC